MARVSYIKKSRVERRCHAGHVIPVGSAYTFAAPGYHGREIYACSAHPFRPSNLTTGIRAEGLAAVESFEDAVDAIDESAEDALENLTSAWEDLGSALEDYVATRQEGLDAWEYGNEQLQEFLDTAENALSEVQDHEIEEWSGDEEALKWDEPEPEGEEGPEFDEVYDAWSAAQIDHDSAVADFEAHVEGQFSEARDIASGLEV
jgi:hypothetical protein